MTDTREDSDRTLAEALARHDKAGLALFQSTYRARLDAGFGGMYSALAESSPPGCRKPFDVLFPHVGNRSGTGFLRYGEVGQPLAEHVASLFLSDLFTASACIQRDDSANRFLVALVDGWVRPRLASQFGRSMPRHRAEEVLDDAISHLWLPSVSKTGNEEDSAAGNDREHCPGSRLAEYCGLSKLRSWLFGILKYRLIDERRKKGRDTVAIGAAPDSDEETHGARVDVPQTGATEALAKMAEDYVERLRNAFRQVVEELKAEEKPRRFQIAFLWLYCGFGNSDIADMVGVSRPAVSQHFGAIKQQLLVAAEFACRDLSDQANVSLGHVQRLLQERPESIVQPTWFSFLLDRFRQLLRERPDLIHVAFLRWHVRRGVNEIAEQMGETTVRVHRLLDELDRWRGVVAEALADDLSRHVEVPTDVMIRPIEKELPNWFANVDPRDVIQKA
jgi:DNA-directed RNA polymerase specialized sigma24 family protein